MNNKRSSKVEMVNNLNKTRVCEINAQLYKIKYINLIFKSMEEPCEEHVIDFNQTDIELTEPTSQFIKNFIRIFTSLYKAYKEKRLYKKI